MLPIVIVIIIITSISNINIVLITITTIVHLIGVGVSVIIVVFIFGFGLNQMQTPKSAANLQLESCLARCYFLDEKFAWRRQTVIGEERGGSRAVTTRMHSHNEWFRWKLQVAFFL
jgi:hypothetical protein